MPTLRERTHRPCVSCGVYPEMRSLVVWWKGMCGRKPTPALASAPILIQSGHAFIQFRTALIFRRFSPPNAPVKNAQTKNVLVAVGITF